MPKICLLNFLFIFLTQRKPKPSRSRLIHRLSTPHYLWVSQCMTQLLISTAAANFFVKKNHIFVKNETMIFFISKFKMFSISLIEFPTNFKEFKRNQRINGKIRTTPTAYEKNHIIVTNRWYKNLKTLRRIKNALRWKLSPFFIVLHLFEFCMPI